MFGKRKLEERIEKLEKELRWHKEDVVRCRNITVYKPNPHGIYIWPGNRPYIEVSHGDAIQRIMDHLGIAFEYVEGEPTKAVLSKVGKK